MLGKLCLLPNQATKPVLLPPYASVRVQKFWAGAKLWASFSDYYECTTVDGYRGIAAAA